MPRCYIIGLILILASASLHSQAPDLSLLAEKEKTLSLQFTRLLEMEATHERTLLNDTIIQSFSQLLGTEPGFYYTWPDIKGIAKVRMDDGRLNVFSWHLKLNNGQYQYFGLVQRKEEKRGEVLVKVTKLTDRSEGLKQPAILELNPEQWMGALYYGGKAFVHRRHTYYILFGFDFNDSFSHLKIIEQLTIDRHGNLIFGGEFQQDLQSVKRVLLEYNAQVVSGLRYDPRLERIVFDHLAPMEAIFSGSPRFYAPNGTYDAFRFEKGRFDLEKDLHASNF